jgi:hypothetical protein
MVFESRSQNDQAQVRVAELERMIGKLTVELEIAKKASSILHSPRTEASPRDESGRRLEHQLNLSSLRTAQKQLLLPDTSEHGSANRARSRTVANLWL